MSLSEELREVCQHINISLSDLAHRAGLSPQNLYMRLKRNSIDWEEFNQYLRLMGVQCEHRILYPGETAYSPSDETIHMLESELNLNRKKVHYMNGLRADAHATVGRLNKCIFTALENPANAEIEIRQIAVEAARLKNTLVEADQAMGRTSVSELSSASFTKEKNQEYRTI